MAQMSPITKKTQKQLRQTVLMRTVTDIKFSKMNRWNSIREGFRKIDMFGRGINFTYKYEQTFKTMEGAILTSLILMGMLIITAIYFQNMINRTEQILNTKTEYIDLTNDYEPFAFSAAPTNGSQF